MPSASTCTAHVQSLEDLFLFAQAELAKPEWRMRGGQDIDGHALMQAAQQQGLYIDDRAAVAALTAELSDAMDCTLARQRKNDLPAPRKYTIRWYQLEGDNPIAAGSDVTVRQACYAMVWLKLLGGMTGQCLDSFCRLLSFGGMLRAENIMPRYVCSPCLAATCAGTVQSHVSCR